MNHTHHPPPSEVVPPLEPTATRETVPPASSFAGRKRALTRLLLYLQALDAPARAGLTLALYALDSEEIHGGGDLPGVMQAVRKRLADQGCFSCEGPDYGKWFRYKTLARRPCREADDLSGGLTSMPPMNRRSMVPEGL